MSESHTRPLKFLTLVLPLVALTACGGTAPPDTEGGNPQAGGTLSWDPGVRVGENSNSWWLEVRTADARTSAVELELNGGQRHSLAPTTWGSFAINQYIPAG